MDPSSSGKDQMYSPKAVAHAIGVSESSLKRWCDAGKIAAVKTAGGHRRMNQSSVISFIRDRSKYDLLDPTSIGLPDLSEFTVSDRADAAAQYHSGLVSEAEDRCHRLLIYLYVNGWKVEEIVDHVVAVAFKQIGTQWQHGSLEIYQERRACEICLEALSRLKAILDSPLPNALTATGGTIENDHYTLCTKTIEVTLISHGWQAKSLGSNLPFASLLQAAMTMRPNLFWLSVSFIEDEDSFIRDLNEMAEQIPRSTTLVFGGNAITQGILPKIRNAVYCDNLAQLVEVTQRIDLAASPDRTPG